MTCIVGLVENGVTWIGGDSLGTSGNFKTVRNDKKVFRLNNTNNTIMGFTTSFRMGQLLKYHTIMDERYTINHKYMVKKFIPKLIDVFNKNGFISQDDDGRISGGEFLVGYKNKLFHIYSDFQVAELSDNYSACGSGFQLALSSLATTEGLDLSPVERIHKALQVSAKFNAGVAPPFYIINTKDDAIVEFKD